MLGRNKKAKALAAADFQEPQVPDLEVPIEEADANVVPPIYPGAELPDTPVETPQIPQPIPVAQPPQIPEVPQQPSTPVPQQRTMIVEEPLRMQIISGELGTKGHIYTVVTNKPLGVIGEIINLG